MRIVMDTSVLVAGLRSRLGASAALLKEEPHLAGKADRGDPVEV
jgi:predicted nucleic acid-binding protein